ncbi:MAG: transposase [Deltaproteobacteria bacterium]|nr:transposase [Deltaproteobacteria bacterium]
MSSRDVWADSAYRSGDAIDRLKSIGYRVHLQRIGSRNCKLTKWEQQGNRIISRIRSQVEHIFGVHFMPLDGTTSSRCPRSMRHQ